MHFNGALKKFPIGHFCLCDAIKAYLCFPQPYHSIISTVVIWGFKAEHNHHHHLTPCRKTKLLLFLRSGAKLDDTSGKNPLPPFAIRSQSQYPIVSLKRDRLSLHTCCWSAASNRGIGPSSQVCSNQERQFLQIYKAWWTQMPAPSPRGCIRILDSKIAV